ncbi:MAG: ketopantoate reductase family protein [Desulfomonilaceae bacterium]
MRTAILGCGALGSVIGGLLIEAGQEVIFIERDPTEVALIRDKGLRIDGVSGDRILFPRIFHCDEQPDLCDLVLVLVKAYDTPSTVPTVSKILSPAGVILTLQNGVGNYETLQAHFPGRVLLGTTTMGAMAISPGHARHTGFGNTVIGEADGAITERARVVVQLLGTMAGGTVQITDNALGTVWSKLIINAAINAPCALLRIKNGVLPQNPAGKQLIHEIVSECQSIAKAKGITLLFDNPEERVLEVCRGTAENICSMLQDIRARRKTEIGYINGALAREADGLGLAAPVNKTLTLLIEALEATTSCRIEDA